MDSSMEPTEGWHKNDNGPQFNQEYEYRDFLNCENEQITDFDESMYNEEQPYESQSRTSWHNHSRGLYTRHSQNERTDQYVGLEVENRHSFGSHQPHRRGSERRMKRVEEAFRRDWSPSERHDNTHNSEEFWIPPNERVTQPQERSEADCHDWCNELDSRYSAKSADQYHWVSKSYQSTRLERQRGREDTGGSRIRSRSSFRSRGRGRGNFERSSPIRDIREDRRRSQTPPCERRQQIDEQYEHKRFDTHYEPEGHYSSSFVRKRRGTNESYDPSDRYRPSTSFRGRVMRERGRGRGSFRPSYRARGRGRYESVRSPIKDRIGIRRGPRTPSPENRSRVERRTHERESIEIRNDREPRISSNNDEECCNRLETRLEIKRGPRTPSPERSPRGEKHFGEEEPMETLYDRNTKPNIGEELRDRLKSKRGPRTPSRERSLEVGRQICEKKSIDLQPEKETGTSTSVDQEFLDCLKIGKGPRTPPLEESSETDEQINGSDSIEMRYDRRICQPPNKVNERHDHRHITNRNNHLIFPASPREQIKEKEGDVDVISHTLEANPACERMGNERLPQGPSFGPSLEQNNQIKLDLSKKQNEREARNISKLPGRGLNFDDRIAHINHTEASTSSDRSSDGRNLEIEKSRILSECVLPLPPISRGRCGKKEQEIGKYESSESSKICSKSKPINKDEAIKSTPWVPISERVQYREEQVMAKPDQIGDRIDIEMDQSLDTLAKEQRNTLTRGELRDSIPPPDHYCVLKRKEECKSEVKDFTPKSQQESCIGRFQKETVHKSRAPTSKRSSPPEEEPYVPKKLEKPCEKIFCAQEENITNIMNSSTNPCQHSTSERRRGSLERVKEFSKVNGRSKRNSTDDARITQAVPTTITTSSDDQESSVPLSDRIFQEHEKTEERYNLALERVKKYEQRNPGSVAHDKDESNEPWVPLSERRNQRKEPDKTRESSDSRDDPEFRRCRTPPDGRFGKKERQYPRKRLNSEDSKKRKRSIDRDADISADETRSEEHYHASLKDRNPDSLEESRFHFFDDAKDVGKSQVLNERDMQEPVTDLSSDVMPSTSENRYSDVDIRDERTNQDCSTEIGPEQTQVSIDENSEATEVPLKGNCSMDSSEEDIEIFLTESDKIINFGDLDPEPTGNMHETGQYKVDTSEIGIKKGKPRPLRRRKTLSYDGEVVPSSIKLEFAVKRENVRPKKEPNADCDPIVHTDRARQFASLLILLKREIKEGTNVRLIIPEYINSSDLLEMTYRFESRNAVTDEKEVSIFFVRFLVSTEKGLDFTINYKSLFSDNIINIRKLCDTYTSEKNDLSSENGVLKKFTIYTNVCLNSSLLGKRGLNVVEGNSPNCRKILVGENCEVFQKIPNQVLSRLANILVGAINKPKPANFTPFLKTYHVALVREKVVNLEGIKKKVGDCTGFFHEDFIHDRNLSQSAKELRHYILCLLKRDSFPEDLRMNLPEPFGQEFVNSYSLLNIKANLDGLESPVADFLGRLEFERFSNNVEEVLLAETGVELKFLENESVLTSMESCLLELIKSGEDLTDCWLDAMRGAMSQKVVIDNHLYSSQIDVDFQKHDLLSKLEHRIFGASSGRRLAIQTNHAFLISTMIQQVASQYLDMSEDGYCCMKIKVEFSSDLIRHIRNLVRFSLVNVLVLDCSHDSLNIENMKSIFQDLTRDLDSVPVETFKKIIIVGSDITLPWMLKSVADDFLFCVPGGIERLSEKSQSEVLQLDDIEIRGNNVKLRELLNRESIMNLLRDPQILTQVLTSKLMINDIVPALPLYDQETYISRRINLRVVIDTNILKEPITDVFIIKGIDKADLKDYCATDEIVYNVEEISTETLGVRLIALSEDDVVPDVDKLIEDGPRNIHLMDHKKGYLVWLHTIGSISSLIPYRIENIPDSLDPSVFPNSLVLKRSKPRILIICGESGMGKSSYLHEMASSELHSASRVWRLKVNFSTDYFKEQDDSYFNDVKSTVAYIKERLECSKFLQELFSICALGKSNLKVTLFLDGFDELPSDLVGLASRIMLQLQKSFIENIYVTVRPGPNRQHLESKLGIFSHNLDAFTQDEECQLLTSCWRKKLKIQTNQPALERSIRESLSVFHLVFKRFDIEGNLAFYPLFLKMLAEIHKDCMKESYENSSLVNNIFDLYKNYVQSTYPRIFFREIVSKKSLQRLLPASVHASLEIDKDGSDGISSLELPDQLCHITFAEFAVADWLKTQASHQNQSPVKILQCIDSVVDSTSPVFLNSVKSVFNLKDHDCFRSFVSLSAAEDRARFLRALMMSENQDWILTTDYKTPLHHAVENNSVQSVKLLLELQDPHHGKLNDHVDTKYLPNVDLKLVNFVDRVAEGKRAVQLAANNGNMEMVCDVVLAGADLSSLEIDFLRRLSNYVARELSSLEPLEEHKLRVIAEKLFVIMPHIGSDATDRKELYPKLLPYFCARGLLEIVRSLMDAIDDHKERNKLLQEKYLDKTPLDYVNESLTLMDDLQRRDIIKYLLEEIELEIKVRDPFYLHRVLHAAVKVNHPKTFKYFVGQYPGGYMGFLESSLRSDDFDVVNFLVYYDQEMKACKIRNSILHTAVRLNVDVKMIEFIINKSSVDVTNNLRETPLCVAIKSKAHISVVKYLISLGANVNLEDEEGLCPWCYILVEGSQYSTREQDELMQFLMDMNQSLILPPPRNLDYDYDRKRLDIIRKFEYFKSPIDFNIDYQTEGVPRLHLAIKSNKIEDWNWCKFLIVHGADVKLKDVRGKTPLHIAIEYSREELAKFLLQYGAIFDEPDDNGNTPVQLLVNLSNDSSEQSATYSMWKSLIGCCDAKGRTLLHAAAETNNTVAIQRMIAVVQLRELIDFDARDIDGNASIHLAARKDHDHAIELLISGGANYDIKDYLRKTPLKLAKEANEFSLSVPLLESVGELFRLVKSDNEDSIKKAEIYAENNHLIINARDSYGMTALHWAVQFSDNANIVRSLIEKSSSVLNVVDHRKRSALHYAVLKDRFKCTKTLLELGAAVDLLDEEGRRPSDIEDGANRSVQIIREFLENKTTPLHFDV
ncbi:hypothetical protein QAD02_006858 [Eretmocerus hayati]|uniref:Uncharacterized protein n=1 Tax=Eretmocerus hayati TaxID=131215 RepID=A0ACC2N2D4_9HYME|nr:hypothetical protein QAD02_006858 [Eretmocerus hayati]